MRRMAPSKPGHPRTSLNSCQLSVLRYLRPMSGERKLAIASSFGQRPKRQVVSTPAKQGQLPIAQCHITCQPQTLDTQTWVSKNRKIDEKLNLTKNTKKCSWKKLTTLHI